MFIFNLGGCRRSIWKLDGNSLHVSHFVWYLFELNFICSQMSAHFQLVQLFVFLCPEQIVLSIMTLLMFRYLAAAIVWIVLIGLIAAFAIATTVLW